MRGVAGFDAVTGGTLPALVWREVMMKAHAGLPGAVPARPCTAAHHHDGAAADDASGSQPSTSR